MCLNKTIGIGVSYAKCPARSVSSIAEKHKKSFAPEILRSLK